MEMHSDAEQSIPVSAQYQRTKITGFGPVKSNQNKISWRKMKNTEDKCLLNTDAWENSDI